MELLFLDFCSQALITGHQAVGVVQRWDAVGVAQWQNCLLCQGQVWIGSLALKIQINKNLFPLPRSLHVDDKLVRIHMGPSQLTFRYLGGQLPSKDSFNKNLPKWNVHGPNQTTQSISALLVYAYLTETFNCCFYKYSFVSIIWLTLVDNCSVFLNYNNYSL